MKRALVMTGLTTILIAIGLTASAYALIRHASPGGDRTWRDTAAGLEGGHAAPEVSGQRTSADAHRVRDLGIGPLGVVLEHQGLALGAGKALSGLRRVWLDATPRHAPGPFGANGLLPNGRGSSPTGPYPA